MRNELNICRIMSYSYIIMRMIDVEIVAEECGLVVWMICSSAGIVIHYIHSKQWQVCTSPT